MYSKKILSLYLIISILTVAIPVASNLQLAAADDKIFTSPDKIYKEKEDFKAVALAYQKGEPLYIDTKPVLGYAWNYDTAKGAVKASKAYCKKAVGIDLGDIDIRVKMLGNMSIDNSLNLDKLIQNYETAVINNLRIELASTGKRELVTKLATILQKAGRYQLSEDLLIDLAEKGEHLAKNALAYHWAELETNLERALSFADYAVAKNPDFFSYHDTRALVLFRMDRKKDALKTAAYAVSLKQHPIALDHYGDILWECNFHGDAIHQWKKAVLFSKDILFKHRLSLKIRQGKKGDIIFE